MGFVVVYDACVLYPAAVRDLLIRLAATGLKAPPVTVAELLNILEARGLVQAVGELRRMI